MFEISFGGFINFFVGMATGMIAFAAIYVYFLVRGKNINIDDIKRPNIDVNEEELKVMIIDKQKKFKRNKKLGNQNVAKLTFELSYELVEEISKYFFPESKYPMLELSVNELLNLNHYITNRLDDILDKPILKNTKNLQITKIMSMYDKKKAIEQNKLIKAAKKYKVGKIVKYGAAAINVVNPVFWFRKLVINTSVDVMTRKVCLVVIGVVGEETTKVYSKKLFDVPVELNVVEQEMLSLLEEGVEEEIE
ncbi:MAG: hypothetical protein KQ78_00744 [Candidatus Izimaplasma bacterium HR2]|nr:MAG: hypothetical protein KQ78_00744 [Candidatus Izimaplasma bacterium HR2]